jgi:hypothetical protein
MRTQTLTAFFAAAFALAIAAPAGAADKLRLQRLDLHYSPTVTAYLSYLDGEGRPITGRTKDDFKLMFDGSEQGPFQTLQTFEEAKEPAYVVVVVQTSVVMEKVIDDIKRGVRSIADGLPNNSKMALLSFAGETNRRVDQLGPPTDVDSAAAMIAVEEGTEPRMLETMRTAIDLLQAAPKPEKGPPPLKLVVLFSDGFDANPEVKAFGNLGKKALDAGVVIDTIGYGELDPTKLKNLTQLAKLSNGVERIAKNPGEISGHFANVVDEIKKQYIVSYDVLTPGGDGKKHTFAVMAEAAGKTAYSGTIEDKLPKWVHPPNKPAGTATGTTESHWLLWTLLIVGGLGLIGVIAWLIFREKPESGEEEPAPRPVVAQQPAASQPMKTLAIDPGAGSGAPAVAWIVATSGKHANQTFKLKPLRTLIGTGGDCDVKVEDQFMSSHHCEVRYDNGNFKLFDLNSTNGIVVNDKKVREHELVDNDLFRLGRTEFKFKSIS